MSNVLLVDTNFSSAPIFRYLTSQGHKVTVVGNNTKDSLAKSCGEYVQLDYSNTNAITRLIEGLDINYLVPGCNDRSYLVCAELNVDGRFPGLDSICVRDTLNNKIKFRKFAAKNSISAPQTLSPSEIENRWPVIVKPADAYSGRGVKIVRDDRNNALSLAMDGARDVSPTNSCCLTSAPVGQI